MLIAEYHPDIVFFDSLMAFHGSDENSSKEMRPIYSYLNSLAHDADIAVVASHHVTKTKRSERKIKMDEDDLIGSSMLIRYASAILGLEEQEVENEGRRVLVSSKKSRGRKPSPFAFEIAKNELGRDEMVITLDPILPGDAKERIWRFIEATYKCGEEFSAVDIETGSKTGGRYARRCLNELIESGQLIREGATNRVRYAIAPPNETRGQIIPLFS